MFTSLLQTATWAADSAPTGSPGPDRPSVVRNADRDAVLGKDWHTSQDRAWTTSADAQGFHLLVADQKDAYNWHTTATLREPGFDADMWIGNACVTGSGKRAVVAYAPRTFTNNPELMARGAFTAVVDLDSGDVKKLNRQASLAYFSPGCGTGETAVFTQAGGEDKNATRLIEVDAATATTRTPIELEGQITSAVPVGKDIVAADANRLVKITTSGRRSTLAHTEQIPFQLKADAEGGVVYMDRPKPKTGLPPMLRSAAPAPAPAPTAGEAQGEVRRVSTQDITAADAKKTKSAVLAHGPLTKMDLSSSANGTVFITGETRSGQTLPAPVKRRTDVPKESVASTHGKALVTKTAWSDGKDSRTAPQEAAAPRPTDVDLKVLDTGRQAAFRVTPEEHGTKGADRSPALPAPTDTNNSGAKQAAFRATAVSGSPDDTAEPQRHCSVPRNDPRKQAMQPKPRQVEWAVDQAITNNLNKHISRPANWKNLGMGAYRPQSLFPLLQLSGGGRIPAQVMLGVTAQESNMWQASRVVVPGVTGNPLVGNFYGIKYAANGRQNDPWGINWDKADCGYGITQITDGMRARGKEKPEEGRLTTLQQQAAALDYTANIAAGVNILADKWNVTHKDGLTVNGGNPKYLESWFFALWAYNSGYYPKAEAGKNGGKWGVGFTNNPANPLWKANRLPFLESASGGDSYQDAAHPQDWPYQEKVLGWAARPLEALESPGTMVHGFRAAWWTSNPARTAVKPPENLFCTKDNECDPSKIGPDDKNEPGLGACTRGDLKCWWNKPVKWKDCNKGGCGNELLRFNDTYKEEADGTAYPPNCTTKGLPGNALVVDDVPDHTPTARPGCSQPKKNSGTFRLGFATDSARIDFQQLGGGYGGHFWFAHTRKNDAQGRRMKVTGTWNFNKKVTGPAKVLVHLPDHGAHTTSATYEIDTAKGKRTRTVNQKKRGGQGKNRWISVGAFLFDGNPKVTLTTITPRGTGDQDIAFDAVAIAPIKGKFVDRTFDAVSIFDPNQETNTDMPWLLDTPLRTMSTLYDWAIGLTDGGKVWDNPKETQSGILRLPKCTTAKGDCVMPETHAAAKRWRDDVVAGGRTPAGGGAPPKMSQAIWMAMANPRPNPSVDPRKAFASKHDYKLKTHLDVNFVADDDGKIIDGSQEIKTNQLVGDAHIAPFVREFMHAVQKDYGIAPPDVRFDEIDANVHSGRKTKVDPIGTGNVPGQAYISNARAPEIIENGRCVDARSVMGGVHGFRAMIAEPSVDKNVSAWVDKLKGDSRVPAEVSRMAGDIYSMFFRYRGLSNVAGSQIGNAPPIWQNISMAFCADGSVRSTQKADGVDTAPKRALVYSSFMPDLWLYLDGKVVDNEGRPAKGPVHRGDWKNFSNVPEVGPVGRNAFGVCDIATRGRGGNPWAMKPPVPGIGDPPSKRPGAGIYCDNRAKEDVFD
ncbi:hypothetical protein [Streptomyces sp. CT34]|uniref:golvesin C-terminal-like domain-containing protein n=1 Tax=Streptomyces sp. CT34 TaxID=1553907 RepID=UPI00068BD1DF|nr:hypothetical protein [Streptomyces sp. CT34]